MLFHKVSEFFCDARVFWEISRVKIMAQTLTDTEANSDSDGLKQMRSVINGL